MGGGTATVSTVTVSAVGAVRHRRKPRRRDAGTVSPLEGVGLAVVVAVHALLAAVATRYVRL